MDDIYSKVDVLPDHFHEIKESDDIDQSRKINDYSLRSRSHSWTLRRVMDSASMFNLFRLARLPWASSSNDNDKVELSVAEIESFRSEIADAEEKVAHLKAQYDSNISDASGYCKIFWLLYLFLVMGRILFLGSSGDRKLCGTIIFFNIDNLQITVLNLIIAFLIACYNKDFKGKTTLLSSGQRLEHIDELLKVARLSGYLYVRTRWSELPGEPPILDDEDVDDWLPRFVVLHGQCMFYFLKCTDLSPMGTTMLVDIVDVGPLPCFLKEDGQRRYALYILTTHGLRFECSSLSKIQVDSWLLTLQSDCELEPLKNSA